MRRLVVLDVGKSNVKLAVLDREGRVLAERRHGNVVLNTLPYPHYDIEGIWEWLLAGLTDFATEHAIDAIVTTTHGACAALVDESGLSLPVLDYEYTGPQTLSAEYAALCDPFSSTYSPALPAGLNLGRQLYWQAKMFPGEFARIREILLYPQYWSWRLSGVAASEVTSLGCHTDLWWPGAGHFSGLVARTGWETLFPPLAPAWQSLGRVLPEVAARTGLSPACEVISGIHDSNASLLPHLVSRPPEEPFTVVSTGTWVIIAAVGASLATLDSKRDMLANVDALGRPVACARFMGGREFAALNDLYAADCSESDLASVIGRGVVALPAFAEAGGPFVGRHGQVIGGAPESPAERYALATLYCALVTDHCLSALRAEGDIVVEGSFTGNSHYATLLAALRPWQRVWVSGDAAGTIGGAFALGNWGVVTAATGVVVAPFAGGGLEAYREQWQTLCAAVVER